jgi:hypothetical protein
MFSHNPLIFSSNVLGGFFPPGDAEEEEDDDEEEGDVDVFVFVLVVGAVVFAAFVSVLLVFTTGTLSLTEVPPIEVDRLLSLIVGDDLLAGLSGAFVACRMGNERFFGVVDGGRG